MIPALMAMPSLPLVTPATKAEEPVAAAIAQVAPALAGHAATAAISKIGASTGVLRKTLPMPLKTLPTAWKIGFQKQPRKQRPVGSVCASGLLPT